jgi:catalase
VNNYNQDGVMSNRKKNSDINFQPNTDEQGYKDDNNYRYSRSSFNSATTIQQKITKPNDFKQAGDFYRSLDEKNKNNLINNLYGDLSVVENKAVLCKMVAYFYMADSDYGKRLAAKLKLSREEVESSMRN